MEESRFEKAMAAIDSVNARDPNSISIDGAQQPKELAHGKRVSYWLGQLVPDANEELQLAGRAHHIERWILPRAQYPAGRTGYLDWRKELQKHHARKAGDLLAEAGYSETAISRVQDILQKKNLRRDPDVQAFEDALCLVFLETQFHDVASRLSEKKMVSVLRLTLPKMSQRAQEAALAIDLGSRERELLDQAIQALSGSAKT